MTKLTTREFQVHIADQFIESLTEPANTSYYVFLSHPRSWDNENSPPTPTDVVANVAYNVWDDMICGKAVTDNDVKLMARRYDWTPNTVYSMYDDRADLANSNFFVVVNESTSYHVYKCLNNANGAPSTSAPTFASTSADDEFYATADGYQWKYMYTIDTTTFNRFATSEYIPYVPNANVAGNAVSGALEMILVENSGTRYNAYANGYFQAVNVNGDPLIHTIEPTASANTDFYKNSAIKIVEGKGAGQQRKIREYIVSGGQKNVYLDKAWDDVPDATSRYEISPDVVIVGDGTGAQARGVVNATSNSIAYVEITNRGEGYSWATATLESNTGIFQSNSLLLATSATLRPIISPPGGHGSDIPSELGMVRVGISVAFANTESGTIPATNKFRTFGLLKDPKFNDVKLTLTSVVGSFADGETIETDTGARGIATGWNNNTSILSVTNFSGKVDAGHDVLGLTSNASATVSTVAVTGYNRDLDTFDQRTRFDIVLNGATQFAQNDAVVQSSTNANGYVHEANTTFLALTNTKGDFTVTTGDNSFSLNGNNGASANVTTIHAPDLIKSSGKILYIENHTPVLRSNTSTETIRLVIGF